MITGRVSIETATLSYCFFSSLESFPLEIIEVLQVGHEIRPKTNEQPDFDVILKFFIRK